MTANRGQAPTAPAQWPGAGVPGPFGAAIRPQPGEAAPSAWLFSKRTDLLAFVAPAVAALLLVGVGLVTGAAQGDTPPVLWLAAVLLVDLAHVWSTIYRVYTDPQELRRRPGLYYGAPVAVFVFGMLLHLHDALLFWRVLAYAAVFHFVRQQYGWLRLYRKRGGEVGRVGAWIDGAAIYLATMGPLFFWHAATPRHFTWFLPGDFLLGVLPPWCGLFALGLEAVALAAYLARAIHQAARGRPMPWGKHALVLTTAVCWYVGIVAFDSDFVFTVTNVLIHGIPYFVLVWRYGQGRYVERVGVSASRERVPPPGTYAAPLSLPAPGHELPKPRVSALFRLGWPAFYAPLVLLAFAEEGLWDKLVWHDHAQFFGTGGWTLTQVGLAITVALLAVPQATHYVLDGFVWRGGRQNPGLAERLGL